TGGCTTVASPPHTHPRDRREDGTSRMSPGVIPRCVSAAAREARVCKVAGVVGMVWVFSQVEGEFPRVVSRTRMTRPVRGLGPKDVDLRGVSSPRSATAYT